MSKGPTGNGVSYWATIQIEGAMSPEKLKKLVKDIEDLIRPAGGKIVTQARASTDGQPSFTIGFPNA
jgi:hypothetical protein